MSAAAGAISVLVALMASGSVNAQHNAENALVSLGHGDEANQSQITAQLVDLLGSGLARDDELGAISEEGPAAVRAGSGEERKRAHTGSASGGGSSESDGGSSGGGGSQQMRAQKCAATVLWRMLAENPSSHSNIAHAGKTAELVALLRGGSQDARKFALWALSLSISAENQETVLAEGGVAPIVAALANSPSGHSDGNASDAAPHLDAAVVCHASAALALLARDSKKAQKAIAEADGVAPLIQMVASKGVLSARESSAAALADLALLPANAEAIVNAGAIAPLVALLREGRDLGKQCSAAALARLAHGEVALTAIAEAGAIMPLIALLGGEHGEGAQREGAHALYALADFAPNRVAITQLGGIGPLVVLLGERAMRGPTSDHAEAALVRLSIEQANRVRIIEKLVSMLDGTEGAGAQEEAAAALAKLAQDSLDNRISIVDAGGIKPLLKLLSSPSAKAKENAVSAITHLAYKSSRIQTALTKEGGIPLIAHVLVTVSSSGNAKELLAASHLCSLTAQAVSQLADGNKENQSKMAEAGAIPPLVSMVNTPNASMQANAAVAISALSRAHTENQGAVARTGAIAPLCALVREGAPEVKEQSAAALWALSEANMANKATIAKLGGIEPLVTLVVDAHSEGALANAQGGLISLSNKHAENRSAIAKLIVKLIAKLGQSSASASSHVHVLCTVRVFAEDGAPNQMALANAGAIPQLIARLAEGDSRDHDYAAAQREAAHALLALATGNPTLQSLIVKSAGVPPLISLVDKGSVEAQQYAARALLHLAVDSNSAAAIASSGGITPLVAMLSSSEGLSVETAASTLSRLARVSPAVALRVAHEGGITPLVRLLTQGSEATQQQAAAAIADVGNVAATRDMIADAGGIVALVALLASKANSTAETAARALANLARDGAIDEHDAIEAEGEGERLGERGRAARRSRESQASEAVGSADTTLPTAVELATSGPSPSEATLHARGCERRRSVADAGGVATLIRMLYVPSVRDSGHRMAADQAPVGASDPAGTGLRSSLNTGEDGDGMGVACMAAVALSHLAGGDLAMQEAVIGAGGVVALLHLLRNGSQTAQEHAASAFLHLCESPANQQAIVDAGLISELVSLSKVGTARAQELAAQCISDLAKGAVAEREGYIARGAATSNAHGDRTTKEGIAPTAEADTQSEMHLEGVGGQVESQQKAPRREGTESLERIRAIAAAGGIAPLVSMLTTGNAACKERAVSALVHLSVDPLNQETITRSGGIPPIVTLLESGTPTAHGFAAAALARLAAGNANNQVQIAKRLVTLLAPAVSEGAQQRAAAQLWELARCHPGAAAKVVNAGAIAPLVILAGQPRAAEAKAAAVSALACLAEQDASNRLAIATGLVTLQRLPPDESKAQVSSLLAELSQPDASISDTIAQAAKKTKLADRGTPGGVRKVGRSKTAPRMNIEGAAMLRSLIETPDGTGSATLSSSANLLKGLLEGMSSTGADLASTHGKSALQGPPSREAALHDLLRISKGSASNDSVNPIRNLLSSSRPISASHPHGLTSYVRGNGLSSFGGAAAGGMRSLLEVSPQQLERSTKRPSIQLSVAKTKQGTSQASTTRRSSTSSGMGASQFSNRGKGKTSSQSHRSGQGSQRDPESKAARDRGFASKGRSTTRRASSNQESPGKLASISE